jgi:hypothetical protein
MLIRSLLYPSSDIADGEPHNSYGSTVNSWDIVCINNNNLIIFLISVMVNRGLIRKLKRWREKNLHRWLWNAWKFS